MDLFVIADLSRVWVQADVYERDIQHVHLGQKAGLTLEALPGRVLEGTVQFISPVVGETTRTAKVRLEFENRVGLLKPGMYTTVQLTHQMGKGLALPEEALIDTGQRKIVFVALGEGRFQPRDVQIGGKVDAFFRVLSGLSENEAVVTSAQFLLDSESRLNAAGGGMPGHGDMSKDKK
jgi:Cu(I)/Ag(I) efflux system membrane fusion protein